MRYIYLFIMLFSFSACANPKREANTPPGGQGKAQGEVCAYKLKEVGLCATVVWENVPSTKESSSMYLIFQKLDTDYAPLAKLENTLKVYLWMPDMGHGSRETTITEVGAGIYQIKRMEFVMPGAWEVRVELLGKDQNNKDFIRDQFKVNLKL